MPPNGFNPIRANKNFARNPEKLAKVLGAEWEASSHTDPILSVQNKNLKEGTSAVLLQSGLDERWWSDAMEDYCYLRNVQDLLVDGNTQYERRFGKGPTIPFWAMVEYHPTSPKDQARIHQFGKKVLPEIFLVYELIAGEF